MVQYEKGSKNSKTITINLKGEKLKIDIKNVGCIQQDFTNRTIRVLDKNTYCIWEQSYNSEDTFNRVFREVMKRFDAELHRREKELNKV